MSMPWDEQNSEPRFGSGGNLNQNPYQDPKQNPFQQGQQGWGQHNPQRRQGWNPLLKAFLIAGMLFLVLFVGGGFFLWKMATGPVVEREQESLEEKTTQVIAAFTSDEMGVEEKELRNIKRLLNSVISATSSGNDANFRKLIDLDAFYGNMRKSGFLPRQGFVQNRAIKDDLAENLSADWYWSRYHLSHVTLDDNSKKGIVYGYFWDNIEECLELRWWISKKDKRWKIVDWEVLREGLRGSSKEASRWIVPGDFQLSQYHDLIENINEANGNQSQGDYEQASQILTRTGQLNVPSEFKGISNLMLANSWSQLGNYRKSLETSLATPSPKKTPGLFYIQAVCYEALGRHKEVLAATALLEETLGPNPSVLQLKAEALVAMERKDEAALLWREILKVDPENFEVLRSFAPLLDDNEKDQLAEVILRCEDPKASAIRFAQWMSYRGDVAAIEAMLSLLKELDPNSFQVDFLKGMSSETNEQYREAADFYKAALDKTKNEDEKEQIIHHFLDAVTTAEDELAAYHAAPDPQKAFQYLLGGYDDEELLISDKITKQLLAAHRLNFPDDPRLEYYSGLVEMQDHQHAQALKFFARGISLAKEEYLLSTLRYQYELAMAYTGKGLQAYQDSKKPNETYRSLANTYLTNNRLEDLERLVELHNNAQPEDEWGDYYAAQLFTRQKKYQQADQLLERGAARNYVETPYLKSMYRNLRIDLRIEQGDPLSAYRDFVDLNDPSSREEVFNALAQKLSSKKQWRTLKSLLTLHRIHVPNSPELLRYQVDLHWELKQYQKLLDCLSNLTGSSDRYAEFPRHENQVVRCLLKLGQKEEALAAAEEFHLEHAAQFPLLLVHASNQDLETILERCRESVSFREAVSSAYHDEEIGPILKSSKFLPLRELYPPMQAYYSDHSSVVLLLKKPADISEARLREIVEPVFEGEMNWSSLPEKKPALKEKYVLASDTQTRLLITSSGIPYASKPEYSSPGFYLFDEPKINRALADHQASLMIDLDKFRGDSDLEFAALGRVILSLLDDNCLAVYFPQRQEIVLNSPLLKTQLEENQLREYLLASSEEIWLVREEIEPDEESKTTQLLRRQMRSFAKKFANRQDSQSFQLQIQIHFGQTTEQIWMKLEKVEQGEYGGRVYSGHLLANSVLDPKLIKGEPLEIREYAIHDWKQIEGEKIIKGSDIAENQASNSTKQPNSPSASPRVTK